MTAFALICVSAVTLALSEGQVERLAQAIFRAEGGAKTSFPYGIKSIPIRGKTPSERQNYARKICKNTIRKNYFRWSKAGKPGNFIDWLGDRYCPPQIDKDGNKNWKKNVRFFLREQIK